MTGANNAAKLRTAVAKRAFLMHSSVSLAPMTTWPPGNQNRILFLFTRLERLHFELMDLQQSNLNRHALWLRGWARESRSRFLFPSAAPPQTWQTPRAGLPTR